MSLTKGDDLGLEPAGDVVAAVVRKSVKRADVRERRRIRQDRWLNGLAVLQDGTPAWEAAKRQPNMDAATFRRRLRLGWKADRVVLTAVKLRQRRGVGSPGSSPLGDDTVNNKTGS